LVKSQNMLVCLRDQKIVVFHLTRLYEQIIYRKLLEDHKFPTEDLQSPLHLNNESLNGLLRTLLSMTKSTSRPTDPYEYYTDDRLINNGFKIRQIPGECSYDTRVELIALTSVVKFFGLSDLIEVLTSVRKDAHCKVSETRPATLKHFLQAEAVRMAAQSTSVTSLHEANELLENAKRIISDTANSFQSRPIMHELCDLNIGVTLKL